MEGEIVETKETSSPKSILMIEDDEVLRQTLAYNLKKEGYHVLTAADGPTGLEMARSDSPHLIILDLMLPELDGLSVCRILRREMEIPIIILTARSGEIDKIVGFESGADDYITKPIKPRALMSRISALFRRDSKKSSPSSLITIGELTIDRTSYTIKVNDKEINLPKKEFELLYFLAQNPNKVFSREDLLQNIWGSDVYVLARTVDVHIRKVREKIGDDFITTVKGVGYKFSLN